MIFSSGSKIVRRLVTKVKLYNTFSNHLKVYNRINSQRKLQDIFFSSGSKILELLMTKVKMDDFFANHEESSAITHQPGYVFIIIIICFYCLNTLIKKELDSNFGNEWNDKNIGYAVSVNKNVLDNVLGSKQNLNELLYASGLVEKKNENRKAHIATYGEDILPALQYKLKYLEFKMKSYFVVAQVYSTHIQLTLHQVVRLSSSEQSATTIIIEDEIIQTEDVYDTLCKRVWNNMLHSGHVEYCTEHKDEKYASYDFGSLLNYNNIWYKLKSCLVKLVGRMN